MLSYNFRWEGVNMKVKTLIAILTAIDEELEITLINEDKILGVFVGENSDDDVVAMLETSER